MKGDYALQPPTDARAYIKERAIVSLASGIVRICVLEEWNICLLAYIYMYTICMLSIVYVLSAMFSYQCFLVRCLTETTHDGIIALMTLRIEDDALRPSASVTE